jgi:uncharacterized protein
VTNNVDMRFVLTFDGQDDYIDFGKNDVSGVFAEGSSVFTVSGWVNPHQLTNKATTYGTHNVFFARSSDRYSDNFEFGISQSGNLDVYIDEKVDNAIKTFGNGELTVGQWHFFGIVFNQGQLTIYLDDSEYTGSLAGPSLNKATSSLTLGATLHNNVYFTGQLANISVWNYPCSQTQVQNQRYQPIAGNEEGLVAYWALDEGEEATVRDLTGNSCEGKLRGNPTWDVAEFAFTSAQSFNQGETQDEATSNLEENSPLIETLVPQSATTEATADKGETQGEAITNLEENSPLIEILVPQSATTEATTMAPVVVLVGQVETAQTIQSGVSDNIQQQKQLETLTQEQAETMNTTANPKYKILSIDGGGIRGIIPALVLAEIEKRTQKQIFSLFDLIAGTSTGGILALGLTKPRLNLDVCDSEPIAEYSAQELVKLYVEYGAEIFYEPFFEKLFGPIEDIFIQPKYSSKGREEILRQYFGDAPLDKNLKEVFVTSYDIEQRIPIFFTNKLEKQQTESRKFRNLCGSFTVLDAALATSATPTYFAPHRIPTTHNTNRYYTLVDGGLVANNPASLAIMEAQMSKQENERVLNTKDILVVSLGTGSLTSVYPYNEVKNWGLLQWGKPLLNIVLDGGSEVVAGELERLFEFNNQTKNYYRFQTFLNAELEEIDNVKLENIRELQVAANRMIAEKSKEIDDLCSILLN